MSETPPVGYGPPPRAETRLPAPVSSSLDSLDASLDPARDPAALPAAPRRSLGRRVLVGAVSVLAVLGLALSNAWENVETWWAGQPHSPVQLDDDGAGTIGAATVQLARLESAEQLVNEYDETYEPPEGWLAWLATFDVVIDGEPDSSSVTVSIVGDDGKTYERAVGISGFSWLTFLPSETETVQEVLVLPVGVEPVLVRIMPSSLAKNPYWEFPVG